MTVSIFAEDSLIGESDLEHHDEGMNVRIGRFRPLAGYGAVQPIFRAVSDAIEANVADGVLMDCYRNRDALDLTARFPDGTVLPSSGIHIVDHDKFPDELEITVFPPEAS